MIATCNDASVSCLCAQLEALLSHGLISPRRRGAETSTSQSTHFCNLLVFNGAVDSWLVACRFSLSTGCWPLIKQVLVPSDLEALTQLQHIDTESGLARAWIRFALNERCLDRYLKIFAADGPRTATYYHDWALVRDEERLNMVVMLLVGLQSIVFAITLDRPELNAVRVEPSIKLPSASNPPPNMRPIALAPDPPRSADSTPAAAFVPVAHTETLEVTKKKKKKKDKEKRKKKVVDIDGELDEDEAPIVSEQISPATSPSLRRTNTMESIKSFDRSVELPSRQESMDSGAGRHSPVFLATATLAATSSPAPVSAAVQAQLQPRPELAVGDAAAETASVATAPPAVATTDKEGQVQQKAGAKAAAAPSDSHNVEELRHILLSVMKAKEAAEARMSQLTDDLATKAAELSQLNAMRLGYEEQFMLMEKELKVQLEEAHKDNQTLQKDKNLLAQQLKKYVAEVQQVCIARNDAVASIRLLRGN